MTRSHRSPRFVLVNYPKWAGFLWATLANCISADGNQRKAHPKHPTQRAPECDIHTLTAGGNVTRLVTVCVTQSPIQSVIHPAIQSVIQSIAQTPIQVSFPARSLVKLCIKYVHAYVPIPSHPIPAITLALTLTLALIPADIFICSFSKLSRNKIVNFHVIISCRRRRRRLPLTFACVNCDTPHSRAACSQI